MKECSMYYCLPVSHPQENTIYEDLLDAIEDNDVHRLRTLLAGQVPPDVLQRAEPVGVHLSAAQSRFAGFSPMLSSVHVFLSASSRDTHRLMSSFRSAFYRSQYRDTTGGTLLNIAVDYEHGECVEALIEAGHDVNLLSARGCSFSTFPTASRCSTVRVAQRHVLA